MNNKRFFVGFLLVASLILLYSQLLIYLRRTYPDLAKQSSTTQPTEQPAPATNPSTQAPGADGGVLTTAPTISPATTSITSSLKPLAATQPTPADLGQGTSGGSYAMAISISPRGAGIDSVVLNEFKQVVDKKEPYRFQHPYDVSPDTTRPLATRSVAVDGVEYPLADVPWKLDGATQSSAVYTLDLAKDGVPILRLRKTFELRPRTDPSAGYETLVTLGFENLTDHPLKVKTTFNGPTTPPREVDKGPDRQIVAGYIDSQGSFDVRHHFVDEYQKDKTSEDVVKNDKGLPMLWAGTGTVYFNAFVRPDPLPGTKGIVPDYIAKVQTQALNPDAPVEDRAVAMTFDTTELTVAPGSPVALPLRVYFGPRDRNILDNSYYSAFPFNYNATLVITSGPCAKCTFDWLIQILVWLLNKFHFIVRDWGLAIICLVCLVRLILHPITKRSQMSMMKMGKMGPEMERLKKKHGDDKEALNKAMVQFYKEQGVTPILGCLPMFLQMPIWIALWQALQTEFALRHAPFLWGMTWIHDLAKPDALIKFGSPIPLLFGWTLQSINILPMLMAVVTIINQKYMPQPAATTPEQVQQQKMMKWMSVIFPLMFYTMPSGLNLYYVTSMGLGIIESKRIRDHIKQREDAEKEGKVFVETKPTRQSKQKSSDGPSDPPKKGGLFGWLADLQARAEELRNTDRRDK